MRNKRILSILFASLLLMQSIALPVWAEPAEDQEETETTSVVEEETADTEETEESTEATGEEASEATEASGTTATEPTVAATVPAGFAGDASVSLGSHTLNALYPTVTTEDYTANAKAAIAYEVGTDTLVYASNVDEKLYPASMTKVMTCLVALEMCDLDEIITVNGDAISYLDVSGSGVGLQDGEQMSMRDLLYCLMVKSANDAAVTIATHLAGSEEAFVELMNQKAAELGCTNTHFVNAHGLHDENHYTTARDMAKIMAASIQNETFYTLFSETYYQVPATNKSEARELYTTNYLMSDDLDQNYYDSRVIGGKTGFTTPAGRCLTTLSESNGMKLIIVIMGAEAEFAEDGYTALSYGNFEETAGLMDYIYSGFMPAQVLSANQILEQFPVNGGVTDTQGYTQQPRSTILPVGSDMKALRYEIELDNGGITAPVKSGDSIGVARVWNNSKCVAQETLYSSVDVAQEVVGDHSGKPVNPAALIHEKSSHWNTWLIVILVILVVLVLLAVVMHIRNSIIRARRKKRRAMRRRRR